MALSGSDLLACIWKQTELVRSPPLRLKVRP